MFGYRVLLVGMLLTPASRLMVVPGIGFSFGDAFLLLGVSALLLPGGTSMNPWPTVQSLWPVVIAGYLSVTAVILSGLVRQQAPFFEVASLSAQYLFTLVFLPMALSKLNQQQLERAVWMLVVGFVASVLTGLALIFGAPRFSQALYEAGYLIVLESDRHGLFTGVAEIGALAASVVALLYFLARRGQLHPLLGILGGIAVVMAVLVSRVASGMASLAITLAVLAVFHRKSWRTAGGRIVKRAARTAAAAAGAAVLGAWALARFSGQRGDSLIEKFTERLISPIRGGDLGSLGSAETRFVLLEEGWSTIARSPFLGTGPGLYSQQTASGEHVHVVPLMMWAETGVLAFIAWIVLIGGLTIGLFSSLHASSLAAPVGFATLAAAVTGHMAVPYMYGRAALIPLLLLYILSLRAGTDTVEGPGSPDDQSRCPRLRVPVEERHKVQNLRIREQ